MKTTYAVVDIETTGTDPKTDRIIQFGCVLVEEGKIVSRFAADINPNQPIPPQIQKLTHIPNKRVRKAPYFEDIAPTIYHLLDNTIFVAHNIHFDYNFLSEELKRCGFPPLTIPGIDTVELAQIFLPTEISFRLGDLSESLNLKHEAPHQADSDAEVTALLLIAIEKKMRELPLVTIEKIASLSSVTSRQTGDYIKKIAGEMKEDPQKLDTTLEVVEGIALKKKSVSLFEAAYYGEAYPKTKAEKQKLYQEKLVYRKEQAKLMDLVYQHFTKTEEKNLLVEAATGMGKTIGYLLPASFLATPEKPLIISTVSILLQQQLKNNEIPLVNEVLTQKIQATVVKSKSHYIDLQRFKKTLEDPIYKKQYGLYQMGILVWLTQTDTGDFDELNILQLNHLLFQEISHRGINQLAKDQAFYKEDFLRHVHAQMKQSNVLIVNHALLAQETQRKEPILPKSSYLLIDEAHHLPDVLEHVSHRYLDSAAFSHQFVQLQEEGQLFTQVHENVKENTQVTHLFDLYQAELEAIVELQEDLFEEWFATLPVKEEVIITKEIREQSSKSVEKKIQRLLLYYGELVQLQEQILNETKDMRDKWQDRKWIEYGKLLTYFEKMTQQANFIRQWLTDWESHFVHRAFLYSNQKDVRIQLLDFNAALVPNTSWYERYQKIIYLGGTLKVSGDRHYFAKKLGIAETPLKVIPNTYDYENQARFFVIDKGVSIPEMTADEYANYLVKQLTDLLANNHCPALVLFTSHDTLRRVYQRMHQTFLNKGREILAQGFGGSREKLLKRFMQSNQAILFGADSFWEGVDLPGDALQLLIVTRLPFENPSRLEVKARNEFLKEQGINPFFQEAVPKAALKLRQGLGRLIRSETDKGIMILLDRRLVTTKYGKRLYKALPKELPIIEASITEINEEINTFLMKDS